WFDLLVTPALLWRRTRWLAVVVSIGFHTTNAYLFNIGVFPWFMLMATTLFLEPDWPRRLPWVGAVIDRALGPVPSQVPPPRQPRLVLGLLAGWVALQVLVPLRHHLYPGDVAWTEEGHYFSWRMKLRTKSGSARFDVLDPATGEHWQVDPEEELTARQTRKMLAKPELVRQYANHLAERWRQERGLEVEVRARVEVSLNRRRRQLLIDPTVDLGAEPASLWPAPWILPGPTEPVPRRIRR
ncbi:MAG: HTTM domain-containing protein, partial [Myxococcales bacterium]|nr:HTTM domain-containing protein [Myxococcales bacterium]